MTDSTKGDTMDSLRSCVLRKRTSVTAVILAIAFVLLSQGCATKTASYHYTQSQIEQGDLSFHKRIRVDEYINAFPQDEITVPEGEDLIVRVDTFTPSQPTGTDRTLVQVALKTRRPSDEEMRMPVGLCLVVDVSGSMQAGGKMADTRQALEDAVLELKTGDEIAVVIFNSDARVLVPAQEVMPDSRESILAAVRRLEAGGGTNIEAGLVTGYREMAGFGAEGTSRLLLITDGNSNVGTRTPAEIARKAGVEYREGARISTIGIGHDVNEPLLRRIAENARGHYYFVENAKALTTILREDLQTTVIPVARNVRLTLSAADGFRLASVYGAPERPEMPVGPLVIEMSELNVNDWRIVVAELEGTAPPGTYWPLAANVTFTDVQTGNKRVMSASAPIHWHRAGKGARAGVNVNVARNSTAFANAMALIQVGELSVQRKYAEARKLMDLQINNNRVVRELDETGFMDKEIERLEKVRAILTARMAGADEEPPESGVTGEVVYESQVKDGKPSILKDLVMSGLSIAADALPGPWGTIAKLFLVVVQ